jgi:hypothetical protein
MLIVYNFIIAYWLQKNTSHQAIAGEMKMNN